MMLPVGEPGPDIATMQVFTRAQARIIAANSEINPGSRGLHRLNRIGYGNTVKDLLKLEIDPAGYFPGDDFGRGFDNRAGTQTLSSFNGVPL